MKKSYLTVTDQFCGAGGSSQGATEAGAEVLMALNHWKLAIDTHQTNFPNAQHDCTDISACDPRRYPSTDILITSPECTNHSLAKGKKIVKAQMELYDNGTVDAAAERSRATMWDVPRFAEYHNYNCIIVENVVDARKWIMFDAWLMAMHSLGYKHECVYMNSMHCHPTPQSRDRMYVVFWKAGNKTPDLKITPDAYCVKCNTNVRAVQTWKNSSIRFGKYRQQYIYCCPQCAAVVEPYYYASFNCIDWSDIGNRIGDRKKPLSDNTIKRIQFGLDKNEKEPFVIATRYTSGIDCRVKTITEPIGTQPGDVSHGIVTPFIIKEEHTGNLKNAKRITEALTTHTTRQTMALIVSNFKSSKSNPVTDAIGTQVTKDKYGICTTDAWNSFIAHVYSNPYYAGMNKPIGVIRTKHGHELISYSKPKIEDCYYRMLKAAEVGRAMAFADDYKVLGTEKDKVKQYGNAVTPPAMKLLIERCVSSLS